MVQVFGLIVGNRGFFPDSLAEEGRKRVLKVLEEEGFEVVCPSPEDTKLGTVETWEDAKRCAKLFQDHAQRIDGIIVTLPNFGDEKGIANAIRLSGLEVPVLVHAFPDDPEHLDLSRRGDAFCGKISVCNNLLQFDVPFSLTRFHTVWPEDRAFREDIHWFSQICRVVRGLKNLKIGAIGARPAAFNTVRFSEKILETHGISVETIDLSDIFFMMTKVSERETERKLEEIRSYCDTSAVPEEKLRTMAKFARIIDQWMEENDLKATAIQCWTSLEQNIGITPCAVMSMMGEKLLPSACEVDVMGALGMYILRLASEKPSALVDWNNNFGDDPEKCIIFHCGNYPKSVFAQMEMRYADVIGTTVGFENAYGSCRGNMKPGPFTFLRLSTDDKNGRIKAYTGEGEITQDVAKTFGAWGVVRVPKLQELLQFVCKRGFEHHVAINLSQVACAVYEALSTYLGIEVYHHV
ncbi:MAG: L-fucose/L-arabinose isomerase family protein [Candidatus Caldatribacteriaceae bacterium]